MGNREYFERREAEERAAAERATDERARRSHLDLAAAYRQAAGSSASPSAAKDGMGSTVPPDLRII